MANRIETSLLVKGLTADTYALDVRGKTFVDGDIEINGNVNIVGTATTINTQTVQARDNKIELNYSGSTSTAIGGGIEILSGRTDGSSVSLTIDTDRDWNSNTGFNITGRTSDATTNGLKVVNSSGTNNFVVRNDGNVGIGTSTPNHKLSIDGPGNTTLYLNSSGANGAIIVDSQVYPIFQLRTNTVPDITHQGIGSGNSLIDIPTSLQVREAASTITRFGFADMNSNPHSYFRLNVAFDSTGTIIPSANVHIKGIDSSSSNFGLKVQNSGGTNNLVVRNDGFVGIGISNWSSGLNSHYFEALSPISTGLGTGKTVTATFYSTNAYSQDLGGGIALGGKYNAGGAITSFGGINAVKLNSTDGDYQGRLNLWVSNLSTGNIAMTSVSYGSKIRNGMGIVNPTALLHLDGDNADVFISEAKCINTTGYAGKFYANTVNTQNNIGIYSEVSNGLNNYAAILMGGNVGIGTLTPTEKLEVNGNTKITGTLNIGTIGSGSPLINLGLDSSGNVVTGTTGGGTFTGGTVNGDTIFSSGLTATTISGGTIYGSGLGLINVPISGITNLQTSLNNKFDITGGTINGNLTVTGNTNLQTFTAGTGTINGNLTVTGNTILTSVTGNSLNITGNTIISSFTGGSGTINGNLTVTGNTSMTGTLSVTGNTNVRAFTGTTGYFSGTGQNVLTVIGSGNSTSSPIFSVIGNGTSAELFSVTDSFSGSLFSVNDISGLSILDVNSDSTILMGNYLAPSLNTTTRTSLTAGTTTVYSIPTSAYTGAFFDYTLISTGSTGARAGTIMSIWSGSSAQFTEVSTNDIGVTTGVTFTVAVSGNNAVLSSSATTTGWTLKTIVRSI